MTVRGDRLEARVKIEVAVAPVAALEAGVAQDLAQGDRET